MDTQTDLKRELAFLREQMHASDQKIARLQNALDDCEDRLESSGLAAMLRAARLERDQLNTVIMRQVDSNAVSLQAVILDRQETIRQAAGPDAADQELTSQMRADGLDQVEFILSPNIGEDLKPLSKIASGGELSRIMLAMKTILARTASVETIIFDEVDSGIGGATAEVVGDKLRSLAGFHQIFCITHLPQIASKGSTHFLVRKRVIDGRTGTVISELNREERVKEIARLLGGKMITPKAIAHAKEILG